MSIKNIPQKMFQQDAFSQWMGMEGTSSREGFSVVPISIYFNDRGLAKLNIGLGKGKKKFDKRETQKMKDWNKTKQRLLKNN